MPSNKFFDLSATFPIYESVKGKGGGTEVLLIFRGVGDKVYAV
jgi:hypothetical protein